MYKHSVHWDQMPPTDQWAANQSRDLQGPESGEQMLESSPWSGGFDPDGTSAEPAKIPDAFAPATKNIQISRLYGLEDFFKEVDAYPWQAGKDYLPKQY